MGFFLGSKPIFSNVKSQSELRWGKMGMTNVFFCNNGIFYFKFDSYRSKDGVSENGPWYVRSGRESLRFQRITSQPSQFECDCK